MIAELQIARYRFVLRAVDPIELPPYAGSAFRGGFGHAFRQAVCVTRLPVCEDCYLRDRCPYAYVFETPRPQESPLMRKAKAIPHPFVLEPPLRVRSIAPGGELTIHLILIGRRIEYFPYFLFAIEELGRRGLGRDRGRYQIEAVYGIGIREETPVYSGRFRRILGPGLPLTLAAVLSGEGKAVEQIEVQFLTPTRILTKGRLTAQLEFPVLINATSAPPSTSSRSRPWRRSTPPGGSSCWPPSMGKDRRRTVQAASWKPQQGFRARRRISAGGTGVASRGGSRPG